METAPPVPPTRPYLVRAMFEWCLDSGFTPYLAVRMGHQVQVPPELTKQPEIVLNISPDATHGLSIGNQWIQFQARFGGKVHDIVVPINRVFSIYARENGQGMSFPVAPSDDDEDSSSPHDARPEQSLVPFRSSDTTKRQPHLVRIK